MYNNIIYISGILRGKWNCYSHFQKGGMKKEERKRFLKAHCIEEKTECNKGKIVERIWKPKKSKCRG